MDPESWLLFSSIALVATITPGPAALLVTSHSLGYGVKNTIATILGNISGLFLLSLLSVMGLSAIILYSTIAFTVVKTAGAIYLIYLGIRIWRYGFGRSQDALTHNLSGRQPNLLKMYSQGITVALSNPKAIAFTTALFPQFLDHKVALLPQFSILVTTFMLYSFVCLFIYSLFGARTGTGIRNSRYEKTISRLFATIFIGSGVILGTTK